MKIIYVYIIIFVITDVVTLCESIKSYHKNLQKLFTDYKLLLTAQ